MEPPNLARGDGALVSTAADLAVFFRALLVERRLLPEGLLHQMMSVLPDDPPAAKSYGLSLIADPMPCGVGSLRYGVRLPALAVLRLETDRFAIFMVNGSYDVRVASQPSAEVPPDPSPGVRASVYC